METIKFEELVGWKLTAIDPCYMDEAGEHPTLTIGKGYEVIDYYENNNQIVVLDDDGDRHIFEMTDGGKFVSWECHVTGKVVSPFNDLDINIVK